jgi:alpha-glucosidase
MALLQDLLKADMSFLHPHHDGSELYVSKIAPQIGDDVEFRLRVPAAFSPSKVFIRFFHDGEPRTREMKIGKTTSTETWWKVKVEVLNPTFHYRFLF